MTRPVCEFQNVSKTYHVGLLRRRAIHALRDVSFEVRSGCVFGLLGPNRAGKTTLVKALLSICRPTSGKIVRLGRDAAVRSTLAGVGYLHESPAFPRYLTARALLDYYGGLSLLSRRELTARIPRLLDEFGLNDRAGEAIAGFSKGMLQRLALAQALVNDPELLVLDEPTEGMDLSARKVLHDVILRRKAQGKTAILVTHSMSDVSRLCDEVAVLRGGRLAFQGMLADLAGAGPNQDDVDPLEDALEPLYDREARHRHASRGATETRCRMKSTMACVVVPGRKTSAMPPSFSAGISEVFHPGTTTQAIVDFIRHRVSVAPREA